MQTHAALCRHLSGRGVSGRLLEAIEATDRALYVPEGTSPSRTYADAPVSLRSGQTTSQPTVIATMVGALAPKSGDRILEVGCGYGFQTAILARLVAEVVSIEYREALVREAKQRLEADGIGNAIVIHGDGTRPREAPDAGSLFDREFDGIVVSAAAAAFPEKLAELLGEDRRMVVPLGPGGSEEVVVFEKKGGAMRRLTSLFPASFVPLVDNKSGVERDLS